MGKDFWLERWNTNAIGWHQEKVEPALIEWASHRKPSRILVPLCGKTLDMIWLRDHGYEVVGVELSSLACETFYLENKISFSKNNLGDFNIYDGGGIRIINGDFFALTPALLGKIELVYDRAALIALPTALRVIYSKKIAELKCEVLQIVLDRSTKDQEGPPYSVSPEEVTNLYQEYFEINLLNRYAVEARGPVGSQTDECIMILKPKN